MCHFQKCSYRKFTYEMHILHKADIHRAVLHSVGYIGAAVKWRQLQNKGLGTSQVSDMEGTDNVMDSERQLGAFGIRIER